MFDSAALPQRPRVTFRALVAGLFLLALLGRVGAQDVLPPANTDSPKLGAIETDYVAEFLRDEPTAATYLGFHDGDERLPDLSALGFAARIARSKRFLARLQEFDPAGLSPDDAGDVAILSAMLQRELLADETEARWRHDPAFYTHAASYAVYGLFARGFAPIDVRMRYAISREAAIPALLAAATANVTSVDAATAALAPRAMSDTIDFFKNDVPAAFASVNNAELQAQFKTVNDAAVNALTAYAAAMTAGPLAHPSGSFAIGPEAFANELALREGRPIALNVYERAGIAALEQTRAEFLATARAIDPGRTPSQILASLALDHPRADDLMPVAERELADLHTFVSAKHLVTFSAASTLLVRATPQFDRQTAYAALNEPGAFEKVSTQAYYFVTPVDPAWTPEQQEQHLEFFNYASFPVILAQEVVPANSVALGAGRRLSLVREISNSPSFTDGWAHYCEEMLVETGLANGDPRVKLASLALALHREARYLVGLREHTAGMSVERATRFLVDNAYLSAADARDDALRGTQNPFFGSYTLGTLEIRKLRDDYKRKMGSAYTLQAFNDALLAHGNTPLGVLRTLLLGKDDDGNLL